MKLNWKVFFTGFAAVILLAACGTSDEKPNGEASSNESGQVESGTNGSSTEGTSTGSETDTNESEESDAADDRMSEAELVKSDEQPFSIKVLPGYTLTSEEPGRDSLYAEENSNAFMRIETNPVEDVSYDDFQDNMKELLIASGDGEEPVEVEDLIASANEDGIENVKALKVETAEGPVTGVLFEKAGMLVRLTIFDDLDEKFQKDFIDMAKTIQ